MEPVSIGTIILFPESGTIVDYDGNSSSGVVRIKLPGGGGSEAAMAFAEFKRMVQAVVPATRQFAANDDSTQ